MIHQTIVPSQNPMPIQIPESYLGKELEVIVFEKEEGTKNEVSNKPTNNISRFKGILSKEDADQLHQHVQQMRSEWERDI